MEGCSVTVLVTCFNEGALLQRALDSIRAQTAPPEAIIIVNDCSADPLTNAVCQRAYDSGIIDRLIVHKVNRGLSGSRNTGFAAAATEWVIPLDADDTLPEQSIQILKSWAEKDASSGFLFGDYTLQPKGELVDCSRIAKQGYLDPRLNMKRWSLLGTSPCRRRTWWEVGGYSMRFTNTLQDVDFWIRVIGRGIRGLYVGRSIYNWHRSDTGMNSTYPSVTPSLVRLCNMGTYAAFGLLNETIVSDLGSLRHHGQNRQATRYLLKSCAHSLRPWSKHRYFLPARLLRELRFTRGDIETLMRTLRSLDIETLMRTLRSLID